MIRFEVDRKLDNRRESLADFYLIYFKYKHGEDVEILRERIKYKSYSGYCLDAVQKPNQSGFHTVDIEDIGKVERRNTLWEIYCYEDLEKEALAAMELELKKYKIRITKAFLVQISMLPV